MLKRVGLSVQVQGQISTTPKANYIGSPMPVLGTAQSHCTTPSSPKARSLPATLQARKPDAQPPNPKPCKAHKALQNRHALNPKSYRRSAPNLELYQP